MRFLFCICIVPRQSVRRKVEGAVGKALKSCKGALGTPPSVTFGDSFPVNGEALGTARDGAIGGYSYKDG